MIKYIDVAVGVIKDSQNRILITKRADDVHMGGRWEFPGGKVESNESVKQALLRELNEELGIVFPSDINSSDSIQPRITIKHDYGAKQVALYVYDVNIADQWLPQALRAKTQEVIASEGQKGCWVKSVDLNGFTFPDANRPIIDALLLPDAIPITPAFDSADELANFAKQCSTCSLMHARAPKLSQENYKKVISQYLATLATTQNDVSLTLNTTPENHKSIGVKHLHLSSEQLRLQANKARVLSLEGFLSASCHSIEELEMAQKVGVNYVFYSPIKQTSSHPDVKPLGWDALKAFCDIATVPVYALGGMQLNDIEKAKSCGAQGIASISAFFKGALKD